MKIWSEKEEKILLKNYPWYNKNIINLLPNRTWPAIKIRARQLNLSFDYGCNAKQLENLLEETNEAYYWNGFLLADGFFDTNGRIQLTLSLKDENQIKKFANFIDCNIHINSKSNIIYIDVQNKRLSSKIIQKFNYKPNKTYNPPINWDFKQLSTNFLLSHFVGMIDGDGTMQKQHGRKIIRHRISFQIHSIWCEWFNKYLNILSNKINMRIGKAYINPRGYTQLHIAKCDTVLFLKDFVIKNNLPVLERKWDRLRKEGSEYE
jgi:hypothetical protein